MGCTERVFFARKCSKLNYCPRHVTATLLLFNVKAVSRSVAHNPVFRRTPVAILELAPFVSTDTPLRWTGYLSPPGFLWRTVDVCVEVNFISVLHVQPANFIRLLITPPNLRMSRSFSSPYVKPAALHSIQWRPNDLPLLLLKIAGFVYLSKSVRIILSITAISRIKYRTILHICIYKY